MRAILGGAPDYEKVSFVMVWAPPHVTRASEGRLSESADMAVPSCAGTWKGVPKLRVLLQIGLRCSSLSQSEARGGRAMRGGHWAETNDSDC